MWNRKDKPLYYVWAKMRGRCMHHSDPSWKNYGGRGIKVCDRWATYSAFFEDMGNRPSPLHTLERIDNNGDYSPDNCRWATRKEQARNRRSSLSFVIDGVPTNAGELAESSGIDVATILCRLKRGCSLEQVLSPTPLWSSKGIDKAREAAVRKFRAMTHCKRGHEFTPENTAHNPQGWRVCRQCAREKARRLYWQKKAEA